MNKFSFKTLLPHIIAVVVFLVVALIVCRPALQGDVKLKQSDTTTWEGMSKQSMEHKEATGVTPLWVNSMFSGMPAYQIALDGGFNPLLLLDPVMKLWLPIPFSFFFLSCICFYFLAMCLRIKPAAGIFGALAFAYCSYNPIIITAGHTTKMLAMAYAPAVIGGAILLFRKKYLAGFTITAVFMSLQIAQGHQQVSFYLVLILGIMTVFFIGQSVKGKALPTALSATGLMAVAGIIALLLNAVTLFPTYDYMKDSKRGGQLVMPGDAAKKDEVVIDGKTNGLSKEYAFQWSYGKAETMTLLFPGVMGYGNHQAQRDGEVYYYPKLDEDAKSVSFISEKFGAPADQAQGFASGNLYWGDQPFTNGPVYLGAIVCFMFIMGLFYLDGTHKWWLLAASILGMLLALGSNLPSLNYFLFDYLPFYNKFRVPTMALIIPQICFPIGAALFLDKIGTTQVLDWKKLKYGAVATAAVFAMGIVFYSTSDFANENRERTNQFNSLTQAGGADMNQKISALNATQPPKRDNQVYEGMYANLAKSPTGQADARAFVSALREDRANLFLQDIGRSFLYVLLAGGLIFLYAKKIISAKILMIGSILLTLADQISFDNNYLNKYSYDNKDAYQSQEFPLSAADKQILQDPDKNFRVFDLANGSPFENSKAAYYHKSIGGNHAAKLGIYDDLTAHQLSGQPNPQVLNMLNTKYIIQAAEGQEPVAIPNPAAYGHAWFIKGIKYVNGPVAEMTALNTLNTRDSAVIDESYKNAITPTVAADSSASIQMTAYDNDHITYSTQTNAPHVAIFSEVYYKDWKATIDGQPVPIFKANYVLRGLVVPAGKHTIQFDFEPAVFTTSKLISQVVGWVLVALILFSGFVYFRKRKQEITEQN